MAPQAQPSAVAEAARQVLSVPFVLAGAMLVLAGAGLVAYGVAPASDIGAAMVGPAVQGEMPEDGTAERIDASVQEMTRRGLFDAGGVAAAFAGVHVLRRARRPAPLDPHGRFETGPGQSVQMLRYGGAMPLSAAAIPTVALPMAQHAVQTQSVAPAPWKPPVALPAGWVPSAPDLPRGPAAVGDARQMEASATHAAAAPQPQPFGADSRGALATQPVPPSQDVVAQALAAVPPAAWPASNAPKVCPACGGRLVAGGRMCASCGQAFA